MLWSPCDFYDNQTEACGVADRTYQLLITTYEGSIIAAQVFEKLSRIVGMIGRIIEVIAPYNYLTAVGRAEALEDLVTEIAASH